MKEQLARRGHVLEVTDLGWIRWQPHGPHAAYATPAQIAVCAPGWRRGRRAQRLRRAHLYPRRMLLDRPPFTVPLYPALAVLGLFTAGLVVLGPHLRGQVAVALPLALAAVLGIEVPYRLRRLTLRHVRIIDGRAWDAMRMARVLAVRQALRAEAAAGSPGASGQAALAGTLVWTAAQAAGDSRRDEEMQAIVRAARNLLAPRATGQAEAGPGPVSAQACPANAVCGIA